VVREENVTPMTDDEVAQSIAALECALSVEDPVFVRRLRQAHRRDALHALLVGTLLAIGAVLLTAGLATRSAVIWIIGIGALVISVVLDGAYQRRLRRPG
jgi:hypothetical protein